MEPLQAPETRANPMKIAVIGGAGVRTPLLVGGLSRAGLPVREIALYDIDQERLASIAPLAQRFAPDARVTPCGESASAVAGADFVFIAIRAGGIERRADDERTALALGVVGQETVGAAGFAMAVRNIPPVRRYVEEVARLAPRAWIVNFTNPVGIVTQAAAPISGRLVGICDTPTELFHRTAAALGLTDEACRFDYFGLNHLGWLREVYTDEGPQLDRIWSAQDPDLLSAVDPDSLFEPDRLRRLRLLPTEYLFYYYRPQEAVRRMRAAPQTRGEAIARLNRDLFEELARGKRDAVKLYEEYLDRRDAGYMAVESGRASSPARHEPTPNEATGYDRIALAVVHAIHFDTHAVLPLNVRNGSSIPDLEPDDIVEVPCEVSAAGARALDAGPLPSSVRELVLGVKAYERLTIAAALERSPSLAVQALIKNPLVLTRELAEKMVAALQPLW
jgi:6-phospho-beta-glucosidase